MQDETKSLLKFLESGMSDCGHDSSCASDLSSKDSSSKDSSESSDSSEESNLEFEHNVCAKSRQSCYGHPLK